MFFSKPSAISSCLLKSSEKNNLSDKKTSLETGFHLLLWKYVIHSHNVYINIFTCSKEWEKIINNLFWEDVQFIKYFSPWLSLFNEIKKYKKHKKVIFLKNHWIIVHSDNSFDEAYEILNEIENKLMLKFNIDKFYLENNIKKISKFLFPDVVVLNNDIENYSAHLFIENQINKLWLTPDYLKKEDVNYLNNMKQEQYRKKLYINN